MGELEGKVAVVTGAGSGMAKASVATFLREGARGIVAADISGAEEQSDVRQESDVAAMFDVALEWFDGLIWFRRRSGSWPFLRMMTIVSARTGRPADKEEHGDAGFRSLVRH